MGLVLQVDGQSLRGFNNHQAVEVLRSTGQVVKLTLARYLRGPKYDQLQLAMAESVVAAPATSQVVPAVFQCTDDVLPLPPVFLVESSMDETDDNEDADEIEADEEGVAENNFLEPQVPVMA